MALKKHTDKQNDSVVLMVSPFWCVNLAGITDSLLCSVLGMEVRKTSWIQLINQFSSYFHCPFQVFYYSVFTLLSWCNFKLCSSCHFFKRTTFMLINDCLLLYQSQILMKKIKVIWRWKPEKETLRDCSPGFSFKKNPNMHRRAPLDTRVLFEWIKQYC